jgi:nucleoside-diphosphate-sugar epimerase
VLFCDIQENIRREERPVRIFVTGGTGFIGDHLVRRLVPEGHEVFCLVRETSHTSGIRAAGAVLVPGCVDDAVSVKKAFERARPEAVVHCAARVMGPDEDEFYSVNETGTENVCRAGLEQGIRRLVHVSSIAVVNGNPARPLTDDMSFSATGAYGRSKIEAERVVERYRGKGLPAAIIRPCMVYGEDEPHAMNRLLKWVGSGCLPVPDVPGADTPLQLAYVGNVTRILELALEREEALSGTFLAADGDRITPRRFLEILYNEMSNRKPPVVPGWLARAAMAVPPFRGMARRAFKERTYDISRARDLLGYVPPVGTEEGLRRTVKYWKTGIGRAIKERALRR